MTRAGVPESTSKDHLVVGGRRYITLTNHLRIENERKKSLAKSKHRTKSSEQPLIDEDMASKRTRKKRMFDYYYFEGDIIDD